MKYTFALMLFLLFGSPLFSQEANVLVEKVKAKLDKVNDYTAEGRMKIDVSFIDVPPSNVTVYYKKPDKFRVKKEGGISILPKGGISINLSSLLSGQEYDIVPGKDAMVNGTQTRVVKLLPATEEGDVVLTTLYIEEKLDVIRKATISTRENGTYEIELSYGKFTDWGLPDKVVFSFNTKDYKLPKGITFEYEKGTKKPPDTQNKTGKVEISYSSYVINKGVKEEVFQ